MIWSCLRFLKEGILLQTNSCKIRELIYNIVVGLIPMCHPEILVKALINTGGVQIINTYNFHWIRINVRNFRQPYNKAGSYAF